MLKKLVAVAAVALAFAAGVAADRRRVPFGGAAEGARRLPDRADGAGGGA